MRKRLETRVFQAPWLITTLKSNCANGKDTGTRQRILAAIFDGALPPVFDRNYMAEWSRPGTPARLRKMAEALAAFIRNAKRRGDVFMDQAIADWEEDLDFLYFEYYQGRFGFGWPTLDLRD